MAVSFADGMEHAQLRGLQASLEIRQPKAENFGGFQRTPVRLIYTHKQRFFWISVPALPSAAGTIGHLARYR